MKGHVVNLFSRGALAALLFVVSACATGSALNAGGGGPVLRTRAERSGYLETSHYADVVAFLDSLKGRPELSFGSIGKTSEGRDIPYVVASRPRVSTPDEAYRLGRPVVYVQGNIHAGEVEGKEALMALLRDLTSSGGPNALDSIVLIAVPIYNADGNERFTPQEAIRGSQNGPEMVGQRANAQNLDLNRDYMKAETPETRASLAMFNKWDPDVFVDLHTTDGSYHGYALTYAPTLNPAAPLGVFTRDSIMPVLRQRMQARHGFATFDYGDFISDDTLSKGWVTFDSRPRYATNYYGLRGRIAILSEAFSHDPFERRVKSTYAFVQEILSLVAQKSGKLKNLSAAVAGKVHQDIPIRAEIIAAPDAIGVVAEIIERTGDSTRTQAGVPKGRRRTGRFVTVKMPVFDRFKPTFTVSAPDRYVIAASDTQVVRVLRDHGITVSPFTESLGGNTEAVGNGYVFTIDSTIVSPRPFQGHREMRLTGKWRRETRPIPVGSFIVDVSQPLGQLAVYLLEPQSDDGLVAWNYFDSQLRPGAIYPVFRIGGLPPAQ
ncbi:MAG: M14 family metallopeptidase [Gemmatimonadaceae bacterium]|nr:M14 family metallopeptidase [Gemmatimonadaceae bacterium]